MMAVSVILFIGVLLTASGSAQNHPVVKHIPADHYETREIVINPVETGEHVRNREETIRIYAASKRQTKTMRVQTGRRQPAKKEQQQPSETFNKKGTVNKVATKSKKESKPAATGDAPSKPQAPAAPPGTPAPKPAQPPVAETRLSGRTGQILTVVASGSRAHIEFWEKKGQSWVRSLSTDGHVGTNGIGPTREGMSRTPYGAYPLGFAFGTENPGTSLPFRKITPQSWWVEDSKDPQYNTWQEGAHFHAPSEHLADYPLQYRYAVVINYNTARKPFAGSGFFVHVDNGRPTAGCVSLPEGEMKKLLQILHPGAYIINVNGEEEIRRF
jgi:L,D-peptidoglycan transpeptidase YkuD (ErfK/YbiS/YcfS/YnhG family)